MAKEAKMERLFSGIQPTGEIHIGNYLGAIKNWVALLDKYESIFCIVDMHAITIEYDVKQMQDLILDAAIQLIACGLDPKKCTLFVQSHVPEHIELTWILNTVTPIGDLERMTQYKEKAKQHRKNVNIGLFDYPVLQAADIILYKATAVPVGEDQVQHIELSRAIARKFNRRYGETFPEPYAIVPEVPRILGLDGKSKMSKSLNNYISLSDLREVVKEKLLTAMTDPARKRRTDPGNPDVCNIFTLHKFFSKPEEIEHVNRECRCAGIGCIECKMILAKNMSDHLEPIQKKSTELQENPHIVHKVLSEGANKCKAIATETMKEVKTKMGLSYDYRF